MRRWGIGVRPGGGRALLLEVVISGAADLTAAAEQLNQAVDGLRQAGFRNSSPAAS